MQQPCPLPDTTVLLHDSAGACDASQVSSGSQAGQRWVPFVFSHLSSTNCFPPYLPECQLASKMGLGGRLGKGRTLSSPAESSLSCCGTTSRATRRERSIWHNHFFFSRRILSAAYTMLCALVRGAGSLYSQFFWLQLPLSTLVKPALGKSGWYAENSYQSQDIGYVKVSSTWGDYSKGF